MNSHERPAISNVSNRILRFGSILLAAALGSLSSTSTSASGMRWRTIFFGTCQTIDCATENTYSKLTGSTSKTDTNTPLSVPWTIKLASTAKPSTGLSIGCLRIVVGRRSYHGDVGDGYAPALSVAVVASNGTTYRTIVRPTPFSQPPFATIVINTPSLPEIYTVVVNTTNGRNPEFWSINFDISAVVYDLGNINCANPTAPL